MDRGDLVELLAAHANLIVENGCGQIEARVEMLRVMMHWRVTDPCLLEEAADRLGGEAHWLRALANDLRYGDG